MRRELLRVSTILRYPKKKRPKYIKAIEPKLKYLFGDITDGVDASIQMDEPADIREINLYTEGKLVENLTSPWFYTVAKYVGKFTETRIVCKAFIDDYGKVIKTFILIGAPTNVYYCYMLLRWVYYAIKWGTTSKTKYIAITIITSILKAYLADTSKRQRMKLSQSFRDNYLYWKVGLPKVKHNQTDDTWKKVVTINMNILPEGIFKNRKLIC